MAQLVQEEGFTTPQVLEPPQPRPSGQTAPPRQPTRMLRGPHVYDGDLCELMPGHEAVVLVSPSGEAMVMHPQGAVTLHVPNGWSLMVGSYPLKETATVSRLVEVGGKLTDHESESVVTRLNHLPLLYAEARDCRARASI